MVEAEVSDTSNSKTLQMPPRFLTSRTRPSSLSTVNNSRFSSIKIRDKEVVNKLQTSSPTFSYLTCPKV
jgi:hypothetical protein